MKLPFMKLIIRSFQSMVIAVAALILLPPAVTLTVSEAQAQPRPRTQYKVDPAMNVGNPKRNEELARLYKLLLNASSDAEAQGINDAIWVIWLHHGDPKVDALMDKAMQARREYDFQRAISILDQVIEADPDYAEGWNQRATIYFFTQNYEKSLSDVAETLKREPNHFGALSGRGVIRYRQGKSALAIQGILEALKIHPRLRERRLLEELGYEEA